MKTAKEILESIKTSKNHVYVKRDSSGHKLLTLSYCPGKGFRYFAGSRPGGGGRKHTYTTEANALKLIEKAGH